MNINEHFKETVCVKRALRTFLQTAVGYIAVNIAATDLTVKSAVLGLCMYLQYQQVLAAVMNLKEGK